MAIKADVDFLRKLGEDKITYIGKLENILAEISYIVHQLYSSLPPEMAQHAKRQFQKVISDDESAVWRREDKEREPCYFGIRMEED